MIRLLEARSVDLRPVQGVFPWEWTEPGPTVGLEIEDRPPDLECSRIDLILVKPQPSELGHVALLHAGQAPIGCQTVLISVNAVIS